MHAKGNLLFGSACQNGEIFDLAHTRDHQKLKEAMRFYDYIEVQPLECYRNLIDRGSILNGDDLRKIIGYILEAAQEEGKTVIATSDAHYVHPYEKRIRDIYINAKAIGNARHPLYKYKLQDRRMYPAPNQHLLTTQEMLDAFAWIGEEQARQIVIENPKSSPDKWRSSIRSKINCIRQTSKALTKSSATYVWKPRTNGMETIF